MAAEYPDTNFAVIDGYSTTLTKTPLKNLTDLVFAEEQGSYLVGVAAALKTEAKHVGFVGGTHGDLIKKFEAGYTAGVKSVDPSIKIDVQYLTEDPTDGETGFENPAGGKDAATAMYEGAPTSSTTRPASPAWVSSSAVEAAGEGKWAIGVDSDQYLTADEAQKPHILTSMLKRIDTAVFDYVKAFADDDAQAGLRRPTTSRSTASATPSRVGSSTTSQARSTSCSREDQERRDQGPDRPGQGQVAPGGARADAPASAGESGARATR